MSRSLRKPTAQEKAQLTSTLQTLEAALSSTYGEAFSAVGGDDSVSRNVRAAYSHYVLR
jgi:hypothetical protein